jgi:APA family basic amino acid/polyamine antiporter
VAAETVSDAGGGSLFTRQATGLVRSVSPISHIIFNTFTAPAAFVLAIALFWTLGAFPGNNLYVALALGYVSGIVFAFAISTVTSAIPRSGGDYIFVGRVIHPVVGIVSSFCFTAGVLLSAAGITLALVTQALGPSFNVIGVVSHSGTFTNWGSTLETNKGWQFGVGIVFILVTALLAGSGWKWSLRVQNLGFVFTILGLLVAAIVVLANSGSDFIANFNHYANPLSGNSDTYHNILNAAQNQGINVSPGSHFSNTWPAYGAVIGFSIYAFYSTHISGEVRQAKTWKTPLAMSGAAFINMALCLVMTAIFFHGFGAKFFTAANAVSGSKDWPFAAGPFYVFLTAIAGGSTVLAWFLGISIVFTFFVVLWLQFMQPIRALFAYSFDGVLPLGLSKVSPRTHMPTVSIGLVTAIIIGLYSWAVYGSNFFTVYANAVVITVVALILMSLAVIAFAYIRPEIWRGSVTTARVFGVPVTTLAGVGALVVAILNGILYLHYPGLGITNKGEALRNAGIVIGAALVVYFVADAVRRRQGMALSRAASEIPPE